MTTPVFRAALDRHRPERAPVLEVFRHQTREILLAGGSLTPLFATDGSIAIGLFLSALGLLSLLCTLALRETATAESPADREPVAR